MDTNTWIRTGIARRWLGIAFGIGTQVLFLVTVWHLFWFLKGAHSVQHEKGLWIDALLAMQFAVPHSLLLLPTTRRLLGSWIAREFYPLFYCCATCGNLLITIGFWHASDTKLWQFEGSCAVLMQVGFYASWIALVYSLNLSGFGYQTGLPQWWHWVRRRQLPQPEFNPRGAYLWLRHPVYLSFAGLIWFTPTMTLDHAILTGIWTTYILVGSILKDRRMGFYLGEAYRIYQQTVPGYPLMLFGPLAKLRHDPDITYDSRKHLQRDAA